MKGSQRDLQLIIREYLLMLRPGYIFLIYILQAPSNIRVSLSKSLEIRSSEAFQHPQRCKNQWKAWFSRGCGNGSAIPKLSLARAWKSCGKNRPGALPVWKFAGVWCTSLFWGAGKRHLLPSQSLSSGIFGIQDGVHTKGIIIQSAINALTREQGCE